MNNSDTAIATMTLVRDEQEDQLCRAALTKLSEIGLAIFITDGGSNINFLAFAKELPNVHMVPARAPGLAAQVTSSLQAAAATGAKFILYTEPDKIHFFANGINHFFDQLRTDENTGVVIAGRSTAGFDSYARFQVMTETTINNCTGEITGEALDYTYGPFLLNSRLVPHIVKVPEDISWGWRTYAFVIASRLKLSVSAIVGDYLCPPEQAADSPDERIYRMKQLCQSVEGAVLATGAEL